VLLAQEFVALFDRLPKDLIGVAFAAAGGYFLWLKFTAYVDAQMNGRAGAVRQGARGPQDRARRDEGRDPGDAGLARSRLVAPQ
jgi:hypothetical protein